jgi:hypothetical protein
MSAAPIGPRSASTSRGIRGPRIATSGARTSAAIAGSSEDCGPPGIASSIAPMSIAPA